jgi:hypothetical protein
VEKIYRLSWEGSADYIDDVFNDIRVMGMRGRSPQERTTLTMLSALLRVDGYEKKALASSTGRTADLTEHQHQG